MTQYIYIACVTLSDDHDENVVTAHSSLAAAQDECLYGDPCPGGNMTPNPAYVAPEWVEFSSEFSKANTRIWLAKQANGEFSKMHKIVEWPLDGKAENLGWRGAFCVTPVKRHA
jgi:hypothetical protein